MGIPVRRGRAFLSTDTASAPPVIIANETVARQWWTKGEPLGDRAAIGRFRGRDFGRPIPRVVVGVASDTKALASLKERPRPTVYVPVPQNPDAIGSVAWVLRVTAWAPQGNEIRRAIAEIDSRQRVGPTRTMDAVVAATLANSRFDEWLFALPAVWRSCLRRSACTGCFLIYVARRTSEIGTRMGLGASPRGVLMLVLKEGLALIGTGLLLGLAAALAITRSLRSLLCGVRPTDPMSIAGVSALLLGVGLLASYFPARRATRVDPMAALREE